MLIESLFIHVNAIAPNHNVTGKPIETVQINKQQILINNTSICDASKNAFKHQSQMACYAKMLASD